MSIRKSFIFILILLFAGMRVGNAQNPAVKSQLEKQFYTVSYDAANDIYVVYNKDWQTGLCAPDGSVILYPGQYDDAYFMPHGYVEVIRDGKHGAVDLDGKLIVACEYAGIAVMVDTGELVARNFDGSSIHLGVYVHSRTKSTTTASGETVFKTENKANDGTLWFDVFQDDRHGIELPGGTVVAQMEYDYVRYSDGNSIFIVEKDGKSGAVGMDGKILVEPTYTDLFPVGNYFYTLREDGNTRNTGIRLDGDTSMRDSELYAIESKLLDKYYNVSLFGPWGCFLVENTDGEKGICALSGKELIPPRFDNIFLMDEDWFSVDKDGKTGAWSKDGHEIIPAEYYNVVYFRGSFYTVDESSSLTLYTGKDTMAEIQPVLVQDPSECRAERRSFFDNLMLLIGSAAGACYYAALTPQTTVSSTTVVTSSNPGYVMNGTMNTATTVNGYTRIGSVNAYIITNGYGATSTSFRSVTIQTRGGNGYYIHVGATYHMAMRNNQSSYFGYPVSQYGYCVTTGNAAYFFNL